MTSSLWYITYEPWFIGLFHKYTTLGLGHRKFAVLINPSLRSGIYQNGKLPLTSTSGGIYVEYTCKPWFIYYIYVHTCTLYMYMYMYQYMSVHVQVHVVWRSPYGHFSCHEALHRHHHTLQVDSTYSMCVSFTKARSLVQCV